MLLRLVVHTGVDLEYTYVATSVVVAYAFVFHQPRLIELLSCTVQDRVLPTKPGIPVT